MDLNAPHGFRTLEEVVFSIAFCSQFLILIFLCAFHVDNSSEMCTSLVTPPQFYYTFFRLILMIEITTGFPAELFCYDFFLLPSFSLFSLLFLFFRFFSLTFFFSAKRMCAYVLFLFIY